MKFVTLFLATLSIILGASSYTFNAPQAIVPEKIISVGSGNFLASDVITGNIVLFNLFTRQFYTVVRAPPGRLIQGIAYDRKREYIIAAGSGRRYALVQNNGLADSPNVLNLTYPSVDTAINVYEKVSGKPVAQCNGTGAVLIKDVTIGTSGKYAYFSDAFKAQIYEMDLDQLPNCVVRTIEIPYYEVFAQGGTWYTGISTYRDGVIVNSFNAQLSLFVNPKTGKSVELSRGDGYYDGLTVEGNCLYAVDAFGAQINAYKLYKNKWTNFRPGAVLTRSFKDDTFDQPTSVSISGNYMIVPNVNARALGRNGYIVLTVVQLPKFRRGRC